MEAMIFAAGLGTRLRPLTDSCPKALIEVGGIPMLARAIALVRKAGCSRIVVNIHHHAALLRQWIESTQPADVIISDESARLLDTGGGLAAALPLFTPGSPILAVNADIFTDIDLSLMARAAESDPGADVTLLTMDRTTSRYLLFDSEPRMRGWTNVTTGAVRPASIATTAPALTPHAFGGIHLLRPKALTHLRSYGRPGQAFSITDFYIDLCSTMTIRPYMPPQPFTWIDIGKPDSLARARALCAGSQPER